MGPITSYISEMFLNCMNSEESGFLLGRNDDRKFKSVS